MAGEIGSFLGGFCTDSSVRLVVMASQPGDPLT